MVDIWKTTGDLIHSAYIADHNIRVQDVSSVGDLFFNPKKKKWELDHWQIADALLSISQIIEHQKLKIRDKILVRRKIHQSDFLKDEQLQKQCQKVPLFRKIFQYD